MPNGLNRIKSILICFRTALKKFTDLRGTSHAQRRMKATHADSQTETPDGGRRV